MRWIKFCGAVLTTLSMTTLANAGLFNLGGCGAAKSCGCAPTHQPACCKPVIVKPCHRTVHNYQRQCVGVKPLCCDNSAPSSCCAPAPAACAPAPAACAPAPAACAPAPAACAPAPACCAPAPKPACCAPAPAAPACCAPAPKPACCAPAPAAPACCAPAPAPAAPACCAPAPAPKPACCAPAPAPSACAPAPAACAPAAATCAAPCAPVAKACEPACEKTCCNADPCKIAELIYQSQTACYARQRRAAIHKLGDKYDCVCNPEIMAAFIYALNDADESVRTKAADEIGDQIRKNGCCCPDVVAALTCALADCHRGVRREAEQALKLCGYDVVDGDCCNKTCSTGCNTGCAPASSCGPAAAPAAAPAPMPATEGAPAPVPPATGLFKGRSLSTLLGMR